MVLHTLTHAANLLVVPIVTLEREPTNPGLDQNFIAWALLPGRQIVAVLPIAAEPARRELAAGIEQQLADYLLALGRVDLLSRSAVESRPSNPFPYFYYEFGASWLIETQLKSMSGKAELTVTVVDARTGIVLLQSTATVGHDASPSAADVEPALLPLRTFFESQAGR